MLFLQEGVHWNGFGCNCNSDYWSAPQIRLLHPLWQIVCNINVYRANTLQRLYTLCQISFIAQMYKCTRTMIGHTFLCPKLNVLNSHVIIVSLKLFWWHTFCFLETFVNPGGNWCTLCFPPIHFSPRAGYIDCFLVVLYAHHAHKHEWKNTLEQPSFKRNWCLLFGNNSLLTNAHTEPWRYIYYLFNLNLSCFPRFGILTIYLFCEERTEDSESSWWRSLRCIQLWTSERVPPKQQTT